MLLVAVVRGLALGAPPPLRVSSMLWRKAPELVEAARFDGPGGFSVVGAESAVTELSEVSSWLTTLLNNSSLRMSLTLLVDSLKRNNRHVREAGATTVTHPTFLVDPYNRLATCILEDSSGSGSGSRWDSEVSAAADMAVWYCAVSACFRYPRWRSTTDWAHSSETCDPCWCVVPCASSRQRVDCRPFFWLPNPYIFMVCQARCICRRTTEHQPVENNQEKTLW